MFEKSIFIQYDVIKIFYGNAKSILGYFTGVILL